MIKLVDILKSNEYALYHDTRYGVAEQSMGGAMTPSTYAKVSADVGQWMLDHKHEILTVAEIAAAVLIPPPLGLAVAAGIGLTNAGIYLAEGDRYMAGLAALFAVVPGIPSGIAKAGAKFTPGFTAAIKELLEKGAVNSLKKLGVEEQKAILAIQDFLRREGKEGVEQLIQKKALQNSVKTANAIVKSAIQKSPTFLKLSPAAQKSVRYASNRVLNKIIQKTIRTGGSLSEFGVGWRFYENLAKVWEKAYNNYLARENEVTSLTDEQHEELFAEYFDDWLVEEYGDTTAEEFSMLKINTSVLTPTEIINLADDLDSIAEFKQKAAAEQAFWDSATPKEKEMMLTTLRQQQQSDRLGGIKTKQDLPADVQQVLNKNKVTKDMSDKEISNFLKNLNNKK